MDTKQLLDLIEDSAVNLDAVAQAIEQHVPPEAISDALLLQVRGRMINQEQAIVIRAMLLGARVSPRGTAAALDVYGMWVNRSNIAQIDLNLLRVAGWAYRWAGDELGRARTLTNLADGLFVRDHFAEAEHAATEARDFFLRTEHQVGIEKTHLILANTFVELQQFARAQPLYAKIRDELHWKLTHQQGNAADLVRYVELLISYAYAVDTLSDDFDTALALFREAEALLPQTGPHVSCAFRLHLCRSLWEQRLGRYADARRSLEAAQSWLDQGLAIHRLTPPDAYDLYQTQLGMALGLADQPYAQAMLTKLETLAATGEQSPKQRAELERLQALLSPDIGEVQSLMHHAITVFRAFGADLVVFMCYTELAERLYEAGQTERGSACLAEARKLLVGYKLPRRALELVRISAQYDPVHTSVERQAVAEQLSKIGDYVGAAAVWEMIGQQYERTNDRDAARNAYAMVLDVIAQARGMAQTSFHTLRVSTARRRAAERGFTLAKDGSAAFLVSEQMRAQALLDEISNAGIWRLLNRDELREIRVAYEQFRYTQARLSLRIPRSRRATLAGEEANQRETAPAEANAPEKSTEVNEYAVAEATYFAALDRLATAKTAQVGWITGTPVALTAIQAALPQGAVLLSLTHLGTNPESALWATWVTADTPPQRVQLARKGLWQSFIQGWKTDMPLETDFQAALKDLLYAIVLRTIEPVLQTAQSLIIALDETMPIYPFHAAFDGRQYLLERMPVSYVPSGSVLTYLRQRQAQRESAPTACIWGYDAAKEMNYPPLKDLEKELHVLASHVGGTAQHGSIEPENLLATMNQARLIHLSCHGEFPTESPRFAHLVTGGQRFYADDLYRADLAADLLFLDACHSGQVGPGLQGFVGAALVSGVSSVIAAMWQVKYQAARPLVQAFYRHWTQGLTCADALRHAQIEQVKAGKPPSEWAHFYLMGLPDLHFSPR